MTTDYMQIVLLILISVLQVAHYFGRREAQGDNLSKRVDQLEKDFPTVREAVHKLSREVQTLPYNLRSSYLSLDVWEQFKQGLEQHERDRRDSR